MSGFFFNLGRSVGRATIPALRKTRWIWQSFAGSEAEALRAETALGRALAAELRLKWEAPPAPVDAELLAGLCRRLSACVRDKARVFQTEVAPEPEPTALALPGGFVFISVGLLDLCDRQPDELAFVMGHEMAHIIRQHAFDRLLTRVGWDALSALLSRATLGPWLRQAGGKLLQSAFSQDREFEADELGARLAQAAGYHPHGARRLLQRLASRQSPPQELGDYFASHPPLDKRLANLEAKTF